MFWALLINLGTRYAAADGNHQLFSSSQLQVNTSIVSEPGSKVKQLNLGVMGISKSIDTVKPSN